jgi:radical SAM superfamily enzyme YgiQ (UPF0313 family)
MKKTILMVYPEIPDTYWSFKHTLPMIGKKAVIPPLGLMTVAAILPECYDIRLVDMNVTELEEDDIIKSDLIFISAMIIQKESFNRVVETCNRLEKKVVAGGPYPSSSYDKIEGVDYFVLNEAEITLGEFIRDYENGEPSKVYSSDVRPDLDLAPVPRFDLIDINVYTNLALQYSRGCPFNCEFCDFIEMFGRKPRTKSVDKFLEELDAAYATGYTGSLFIVDDNFIGNRRKVKELLRGISRWQEERGHPFRFFTEVSIDVSHDHELLELMAGAGFDMLFIGIETPDAESLKHAQKGQNLKGNLLESVKRIQGYGLEVTAGFIVGFDTDREDIFQRQIDFIQSAGIPVAMVGMLLALPNTQLFRRLKKEGRLYEKETGGNNTHELQLNFKPKMDEKKLIEGYNRIISEIYSPENYFKRSARLIEHFPEKARIKSSIDFTSLLYLARSLKTQLFSSYGKWYAKFLISMLVKKPGRFADAVTLAIKGHHFFCLTDDIMKSVSFPNELTAAMQKLKDYMKSLNIKRGVDRVSELKSYVLMLQTGIQGRYRALGERVQVYQKDSLNEFTSYCRNVIARYGGQVIHDTEA